MQGEGYADVIEYGTRLAHEQGYDVEAAEAVPIGRNLWRVRFGLAPQESGKFLELEFDAASRTLVNSVVFQRISDSVRSPPTARRAADGGAG
jgi:hypothetical protein